MPDDNALTIDLTKREEAVQVLPHAPILTSQQAGWNGVFLSHYCHSTSHEVPETRATQHVLAIADVSTRVKTECKLDGRFRRYLFGNGKIIITPANVSYWAAWDKGGDFLLLSLCPKFVEQAVHESINAERIELIPQFTTFDPFIQQIGLALKVDLESGCVMGRLYGESLGTALAVHLLKNHSVWQPRIPTYTGGLGKDRLQQATDYINAHLNQDLKLHNIAEAVGMSQYHFCRLFKQSTGKTAYQYLLQQRVERAKELLKQQDLPIAEVAFQCGFANQSLLTRHFRKFTGITPKVYREQ
jgi:AraC family transcriptional regulator